MTSALSCFTSQADGRPCLPLDHACSVSQKARSSRAASAKCRSVGVLPPAARRQSFCSGSVPAVSAPALHFPVRRTAGRSKILSNAPAIICRCADLHCEHNLYSQWVIQSDIKKNHAERMQCGFCPGAMPNIQRQSMSRHFASTHREGGEP